MHMKLYMNKSLSLVFTLLSIQQVNYNNKQRIYYTYKNIKLHVSTAIAVVTPDCNNTWNSYFKTVSGFCQLLLIQVYGLTNVYLLINRVNEHVRRFACIIIALFN